MDDLDVKILRSLISESAVSPSNPQLRSSLRAIAARLGTDDATVSYRYRKLQQAGYMSVWQLVVNPNFFGCKMVRLMVDVQPEAAKGDMIRKLKLIQGVIVLLNFHGRALGLMTMYNSDESRRRTVELISRITNPENLTQTHMILPRSETNRLTETDVAIIRLLSKDARKSPMHVAKELGLSTKTVRKRVDKLRRESTIFPLPDLNIGSIPGLIPVLLSYSYSNRGAKGSVDREIRSHFESSYFWGPWGDSESGYIMLRAPAATDIQRFLDWAKSLRGISTARVDIPTEQLSFPEKLSELLELRNEAGLLTKNAFL
jgi:DNA-binding Lrp family transcriptional regulator